jgi:hypothetical protein
MALANIQLACADTAPHFLRNFRMGLLSLIVSPWQAFQELLYVAL